MKPITLLLIFLAISIACYAQEPTDDMELFASVWET